MSRRSLTPVAKRPPSPAGSARRVALVAVGLVAAIALVYLRVRHYGFAPVDDAAYVATNPHVIGGLTWTDIDWAFTTGYASNWHPLTWVSYMAEVPVFGVSAGDEHLTNVLLHAASTLLLFGWLRRATGSLWRSAGVAALFALHPLHVESVAWISERKDVLSAFFWMLTLWAYTGYVRRPHPGRYLRVLMWFACGLMAKPMVVTLPFVLLLVDAWPLGRVIPGSAGSRAVWFRLAREKVPFLLLTAASSVVTFLAQQRGGAMNAAQIFPLSLRLENAVVTPVMYLWQTVWPTRLIFFYVHPDTIPVWQVVAAAGLLAAASLVALRSTQRPYVAVGWFWYLGTLVPVSGLVQVGMQARADRYTYVPLIGIFIVLCWGAADLVPRWRSRRVVVALAAIGVTIACAVLSYRQVGYWQDGATLWGHAAAMTAGVPGAEPRYELAKVLTESGRSNEAIPYLDQVIQVTPAWGAAHGLRGIALMQTGHNPAAIDEYMTALRLDPNQPEVETNLGVVLANQGRIGEALPHFAQAVRMKPELESAHVNLGVALMRVGRRVEALEEFSVALRINPASALAKQMLEAIKK